jgi:3-oxosteroid 1-dehydrogenase
MDAYASSTDVIVVGSGSAALSAALRAAAGGLRVLILEKTQLLGGTSAMSGAGTWVPANHHAADAGIEDSVEEAITYIRAASPPDWRAEEDDLWVAFAETAPRMLQFLEEHTPLRFKLTGEPDVMAERAGGKIRGRMLSPLPLRKHMLGIFADKIRPSTLPHLFTYHELYEGDLYHHPLRAALKFGPRLLWRLVINSRGQGSALIAGLLKGCLDKGCCIETGARVVELLMESDGSRVSGVVAEAGTERRAYQARCGVVIATGGFEWNNAMLGRYFPGPIDWLGSPRCNEGDGQRLAERAGAALAHMDQANIYPAMPTYYEGSQHGIPVIFQAEPHAILVDRHGRRFVSEYDFNIGEAIDRRDPETGTPSHLPAWVIADCRFLRRAWLFRWYARKAPTWLVRAISLPELAAKIDLPAAELQNTVARFNHFCAHGKDHDFQRGESVWERFKAGGRNSALGSLEQAPFLAMPLNRSILGTKGGVRTNARGQALRPNCSMIAGLYAAGLAMANPIGTRAVGPGTTIGPNLTWGFICGESLLKDNRPGS